MPTPLNTPPQQLTTNLRHLVFALADALDLVGVDDIGHGKRVGIMAAECARQRRDSAAEIAALFDLGLLHDIGVSSTSTHAHLVEEFDWECSQVHCEVGYGLLRDFPRMAWMALPIRYHHTRWDRLPIDTLGRQVALQANLIYLVDRVDALSAAHYGSGNLLMHTAHIRELIAAQSGTYFAPELVALFLETSKPEAFWLTLEPRIVQNYLADMLGQGERASVDLGELRKIALIFSRIVDAKSPFTAVHSLGVASLARHLAARLGVAPENCDKLEIAGLLHDIGKLRVPDEILDKPGKLDDRERKVMNAHSFETFQILRHIPDFDEIAGWASYHHEELEGSGYPFQLIGRNLPLEARILRVADIFQAMVQDRPYRPGLTADQVSAFMAGLVEEGRVEAEIFAAITGDLAGAMRAAHAAP